MSLINSNDVEFSFQPSAKQFQLSTDGLRRILFGDLSLNFRMTRLSLKSDRIRPGLAVIDSGSITYPLRLCGMGSIKVLPMAEISGRIRASYVGNSVLLSYLNDCGENLFSPDNAASITVTSIPEIDKSVFFHNRSNEFQNFDCEGLWWSQAVFVNDCASELKHDWGMLACWKYSDGLIGGVVPVTIENVLGRLRGGSSGLSVIACTGSSEEYISEYPMALFSFGRTMDEVIDALWDSQYTLYPHFKFRKGGAPPEPFNKLGWCSWNAYGRDVNDEAIRKTIGNFHDNNVPVRYIIIDDGWLDVSIDDGKATSEGISASGLKSLLPDTSKFPFGMKDLVEYCNKNGIEAVGLWHALNGYWDGIARNSQLADDSKELVTTANAGRIIPSKTSGLYTEWYRQMRQWGISFVKIDNQGFHRRLLPYQCNIADYMANLQSTLNKAADENGMMMLYCMATHPEIYLNCRFDHLLRISNDFKPNDVFSARKHIVNNFYNSFWLSRIVWPDFDMFQSGDTYSATFARMLAISGSPIYITDKPGFVDMGIIRRLVLPDGTVPRYENLARPIESRFFENPYINKGVCIAVASVHNIVTCGVFNVQESGCACAGEIALKELGISDKCLVYSNASQFEPFVADAGATVHFALKNLDSDLISIAPIIDGFAVIGNTDYYAAPAVIEKIKTEGNVLNVFLKASGMVLAYYENESAIIQCGDKKLQMVEKVPMAGQYSRHDNILRICMPVNSLQICVRR